LYEARKTYIHETLDYIQAISSVKYEIDDIINEKVCTQGC